ncbi:MAG: integrase core domain-containing protein [Candidatus Odinarchaeota archaeon]
MLKGYKHPFVDFLIAHGVKHLRTPPATPQANGIVERAVQNLKREAERAFINKDLSSAQRRISYWRNWYNARRKHAGINTKCPTELFKPHQKHIGLAYLKEILSENIGGYTV